MVLINGLPDFVRLGKDKPRARIEDDGQYYRVSTDAQARFELPSIAYDFLREQGYEPELALTPRHPNELGEDSTFYGEPGTDRLLLTNYGNAEREESLREDYAEFLVKDAAWRIDPDDFYASYDWLSSHPAFWSGHQYEDGSVHWETDFGLGHDAPSVFKDDDGRVRVLLEVGPYMGEVRDEHSIDTRLVTSADTYEQAIIALAKKVDEFYDIEGADR